VNSQEGRRAELRGDPLDTDNGILPVRIYLANIERRAGGSVFKLLMKVHLCVKTVLQ